MAFERMIPHLRYDEFSPLIFVLENKKMCNFRFSCMDAAKYIYSADFPLVLLL